MLVIQQRMKTPLIGSGQIKRRVNIEKPRKPKKKTYHSEGLQKRLAVKKEALKLGKLNFHNPRIKLVFLHWNTKGRPFAVHQMRNSKTLMHGLNGVKRELKKHETRELITAIDLGHNLFNSDWFVLDTSKIGFQALSLGNFLRYDIGIRKQIEYKNRSLHKAGVKSWFQECLKGEKYLNEKYSVYIKDKNPHLTKRLKEVWEKYDEEKITSPKNINLITKCCNKALAFADLNNNLGFNPMEIISTIDRMINQFKNFKPKHLGYLTNEIFWSRQLPKELVRYGTVLKIDRNRIKLLG